MTCVDLGFYGDILDDLKQGSRRTTDLVRLYLQEIGRVRLY